MEIDVNLIEKEKATGTGGSQKPGASVVVVTYNTNVKLLAENFKALFNQSVENYDVIVVDNSDKKDLEPVVLGFPVKVYIKLKENAGLSVGRNIGVSRAQGDIVIFLDDDAIPDRDFIREHLKAYETYDIVGLRGKSKPRTKSVYNYLTAHYDMGDSAIPHYINLEGNSSFRKDILEAIGGFDTVIKGAGGHEGAELSYRIINRLKDRNKLIYYPGPVIYHDYCTSFSRYFRKVKRHEKNLKHLADKHSEEISRFRASYPKRPNINTPDKRSLFTKIKLKLIRKAVSGLLKLDEIFSR